MQIKVYFFDFKIIVTTVESVESTSKCKINECV